MNALPTISNLGYLPLEDAQRAYDEAREQRIASVLAAHRAGESYHAIGRKLGISHVAARKLVLNHRGDA